MLSIKAKTWTIQTRNTFKEDFKSGFTDLRYLLMYFGKEFSEEQINSLLEIFTHALDNSELNPKEADWIKNSHDYFAGNAGVSKLWQEKFKTQNYNFNELQDYLDMIRTEKEYDFALRNIEVTLRDNVRFTKEENILAEVYVSVLNDLLK